MKNVEENDRQQVIPKPSGSQLAKMPKNTAALFVAASVGRLSKLYPHWLLLNIETPHGIPSSRLIVLWQLQAYRVMTMGQIANAITIAKIINAVNESTDITRCKGKGNCQKGDMCLTHHLWCDLSDQIHDFLDKISLEDLVTKHEYRSGAKAQDLLM